ncbi:hypothetical protein PMAYCL1PPCAC_17854 [Pristionchus mayeri]|uniref:Uncharacterized protein n=1 Tax=Pristionchus mayeri TaxID=1317129 RepID=A0AAN5CNH5_9BILA|nr:hypothetical protein PMAYCL1PPCAC_17854 [Pristionchus mayeri]
MMADSTNDSLVRELMNQVESLRRENEDLQRRVSHLELDVKTKENEKIIALKKQQAIVKELKKMAQDEKRRADSLEKSREAAGTPTLHGGDGSIADSSYRSRSMTDGQESVSSIGMLESDNIELINRIADLQRNHGEALHKISLLESTNLSLTKENQEKNLVIEEWVRTRPLPTMPAQKSSTSSNSTRGFAGSSSLPLSSSTNSFLGLRKLIGMPENGAANHADMIDMNKKLQRLLEETLSKNILLQRDLQTLLERTEM